MFLYFFSNISGVIYPSSHPFFNSLSHLSPYYCSQIYPHRTLHKFKWPLGSPELILRLG